MHTMNDLATALGRLFKLLTPQSDEDMAASYLNDAGDLVDLEMRIREIDRGRFHS